MNFLLPTSGLKKPKKTVDLKGTFKCLVQVQNTQSSDIAMQPNDWNSSTFKTTYLYFEAVKQLHLVGVVVVKPNSNVIVFPVYKH
jgi:hypothetical protein